MQRTAVYWLVYEQTKSAFVLGIAVFCAQFPSFLLSILGGVVSDRYNRFRVLLATQIASLLQAAILSALVLSNNYAVWQILSLSVVLGCINAFDVPARQALIYDMIDNKENLPNAIALNSSMVNGARLIGPAISGIVLEKFGAEVCFMSNGVSFVAVIASLLLMKLPAFVPRERIASVVHDLKEGFHYLRTTPKISNVMLMLACVSFMSLPYVTLLPIYARDIFSGSATTFGLLNSFVGIGAVSGALFLASLKTGTNLRKVLFRCTLVFSAGLMVFAYMRSFPVALLCIAITGFGMMAQTTISNTIIQTTVAPTMRGRVISYYAMAFFGMQPLGGLLIGLVSKWIGTPNTMLAGGLIALLIGILHLRFLRKERLKKQQDINVTEQESLHMA